MSALPFTAAAVLVYVELALLVSLGAVTLRTIDRAALARTLRWLLPGLAVVLVAALAFDVPFGPWSTNGHDFLRMVLPRFGDWADIRGLPRVHGTTAHSVHSVLVAATGHALSVPALNLGVALLGLLGLGTLITVGWRRPDVGLAAMLLVGLHPAWLRLACSPSPFPVFLAGLAWTLVCVEVWSRTRSPRLLATGLVLLVLTMQARGEALVLAPAAVVIWTACRRPGALLALRDPRALGLIALAGLALLPRALVVLDDLQTLGLPTVADTSGAITRTEEGRTNAWAFLGWATTLGLGLAALGALLRPITAPLHRPAVAAGATFATAALVWLLLPDVPGPLGVLEGGAFPALPPGVAGVGWFHLPLHPHLTAPGLLATAIAGVAVLAATRPGDAVLVVLLGALTTGIYVGEHDSLATFVRVGTPVLLPLGAAAAAAVGALARPAPLAVAGLALAGALGTAVPRAGLLSYTWPMQQSWALAEVAIDAPPDVTIATLTDQDRAAADPGRWNWDHRSRLADALSVARSVRSATSLARQRPPGPVWWVEAAPCVRPVFSAPPDDATAWLVGGIPYDFHAETFLVRRGLDLDATETVPCWPAGPAFRRCASDAPDARCPAFVCDGTPPPTPPYRDPACQAVHDRYVLDPVITDKLHPGNLSSLHAALLTPGATVGVYEVGARRSGPGDAELDGEGLDEGGVVE